MMKYAILIFTLITAENSFASRNQLYGFGGFNFTLAQGSEDTPQKRYEDGSNSKLGIGYNIVSKNSRLTFRYQHFKRSFDIRSIPSNTSENYKASGFNFSTGFDFYLPNRSVYTFLRGGVSSTDFEASNTGKKNGISYGTLATGLGAQFLESKTFYLFAEMSLQYNSVKAIKVNNVKFNPYYYENEYFADIKIGLGLYF